MSTQDFTFSNPSPNATPITPTKKKSKNSGGRLNLYSPQELEAHFANDCSKRKLNDGSIQTKISEFHESSQLRIHEIDRACVKAFVVCGIPWYIIENPFFVEFLKTLRPGYTPPSKVLLFGRLLSQETAVVNTRVVKDLEIIVNLTLCSALKEEAKACGISGGGLKKWVDTRWHAMYECVDSIKYR
ncbi:hypothetical protein C1646_762296 [Rhizophagus diaphanus]|nr:hypothetical protein C1646_762296 [Rhizophagus diaphanus] [Rhizophagus sp. MUCL 43196]